MICYKDKTFCTFSDCSKKYTCDKYLTDEIKEDAARWWNNWCGQIVAPVMVFIDKPECYEVVK